MLAIKKGGSHATLSQSWVLALTTVMQCTLSKSSLSIGIGIGIDKVGWSKFEKMSIMNIYMFYCIFSGQVLNNALLSIHYIQNNDHYLLTVQIDFRAKSMIGGLGVG